MVRAVALGYQNFHRLAEEFLAPIAEQCLGLRVDQHDTALRIGDDDGIRGQFQQRAKMCLAGFRFS